MHAIKANGAILYPNSSTAMMLQEMGVLAAAPKTAGNPVPAKRETESGMTSDNALPNVVPIKTNGINSPPLNPLLIVSAVNSALNAGSENEAGLCKAF